MFHFQSMTSVYLSSVLHFVLQFCESSDAVLTDTNILDTDVSDDDKTAAKECRLSCKENHERLARMVSKEILKKSNASEIRVENDRVGQFFLIFHTKICPAVAGESLGLVRQLVLCRDCGCQT